MNGFLIRLAIGMLGLWIAQAIASAGGIGPCASRAASVAPSSFSITRNIVPSCSPTSKMVIRLRWIN